VYIYKLNILEAVTFNCEQTKLQTALWFVIPAAFMFLQTDNTLSIVVFWFVIPLVIRVEGEGNTFLRNVGNYLEDYTASHPRRSQSFLHRREDLRSHQMIKIYRVSQKDVYTRLIFRIIMCPSFWDILYKFS
jgi:hypothetical protein